MGDSMTRQLPRFSIGVGDRFAHQAKAQLAACVQAGQAGVEVSPVWNKSNREHNIIGSDPAQTRKAADAAVKELGWTKPYFLDADHINLTTVERFLAPCDFFTLDVADMIGKPAAEADVKAFVARHPELIGTVTIPGISEPFKTDAAFVTVVANKFLAAVQDAGRIYRSLVEKKGAGNFVPEVSMDETDSPQTPVELLIILAAIADEDSHPDHCSQVHRPLQQGRRLRRRRPAVRPRVPRRHRRHRLRRQNLRPAREPQTQRSLRLRQVFNLQADLRDRESHRSGLAP